MNWAPPRPPDAPPPDVPPPDPPPADAVAEPEADPESDTARRGLAAVPAATWVGLLGSTLLLTASVAVVASNWGAIGQGVRVAALTAITVALLVLSERLRDVVPTSAGIVAHVATFLVPSVAISTLSLFGVTWPGCMIAGGIALIVATGIRANRWGRATMHLAQVAGWAMTATGAAALLDTTAGSIAVLMAVGLFTAGAERRSASLAIIAVVSPALAALADAGIGDGTLARAGLVGERLGWSGPAVGLVAATVIGAIARRRRNNPLMVVAAASPILGIVTGLAATDGSSIAWWTLPALALIAAELCLWMLPSDRFRSDIRELVDTLAVVVATAAWLAPAIASFELRDIDLAFGWAIPITMTIVGVALSSLRWRAAGSALADLGVASLTAGAIGLTVAFDAPALVTSVVAVVATLVAAIASRTLSPLAIQPTAFWAVVSAAVLADGHLSAATVAAAVLLTACTSIVLIARTRLAAADGFFGRVEMTWVVGISAMGATALFDGAEPAVALSVAAIVSAVAILLDSRLTKWAIALTAVVAIVSLDAATASGALDPTFVGGLAIASASFGVLWSARRSAPCAATAAAGVVFTGAALGAAMEIPATDGLVMAMLAVVASTGLAYAFERHPGLDAATVAAGAVLALTTTFDVDPAWKSSAWLLLGLQVVVAGWAREHRPTRWIGTATAATAAVSWWFTSGLHDRFADLLAPADIRSADVWLAALSVAALIAGLVARATFGVNSWIGYGAALMIPGLWLTSVHVERGTVWAVPLLLTVGVVATALGAWHRLAAPLVGGTVLAVTATLLATGTDLTSIPVWVWLALGGAALITTAVLIERRGRDTNLRALRARWE